MKKNTSENNTNPSKEYHKTVDDVFEIPLESEENDDDKLQLVIGILLLICMALGIISVFVPVVIPFFGSMVKIVACVILFLSLRD